MEDLKKKRAVVKGIFTADTVLFLLFMVFYYMPEKAEDWLWSVMGTGYFILRNIASFQVYIAIFLMSIAFLVIRRIEKNNNIAICKKKYYVWAFLMQFIVIGEMHFSFMMSV